MTILYHYTSASGLEGIVQTKSFWASDYRFLNDTSEFMFGLSVLKRHIGYRAAEIEAISPHAWSLVSTLLDGIGNQPGIVAMIASFTSEGDLLSQWRGYCHGKGYSIGIDKDWLMVNAGQQGFELVPVVYERSNQETAAKAVLGVLFVMLRDVDDPNTINDLVRRWLDHALRAALAFKDEHFAEEKESRLVYVGWHWPQDFKTRCGAAGIIPYVPIYFNKTSVAMSNADHRNCGLREIIIGPSLRASQMFAVDALLATQHMRFTRRLSNIPYTAD